MQDKWHCHHSSHACPITPVPNKKFVVQAKHPDLEFSCWSRAHEFMSQWIFKYLNAIIMLQGRVYKFDPLISFFRAGPIISFARVTPPGSRHQVRVLELGVSWFVGQSAQPPVRRIRDGGESSSKHTGDQSLSGGTGGPSAPSKE
jgi:hypothetical protein